MRRLRQACADFESVFMRILLREMRRTIPQGGAFPLSSGAGMYREIADDFLADSLAKAGGMGLGKLLFAQLGRALAAQMSATAGPVAADDKTKGTY
jgi:flagellar protein FlgJ